MFSLFTVFTLAQAAPAPSPAPTPPPEIVRTEVVRPLPGQLDQVPVFNSNSPEKVQTEGILLSTFPPDGMAEPTAHLNFAFNGRFDVFAHHVFQAIAPDNLTSLYIGVLVYNPGDRPVTVSTLQAASYLSQPDAPFIELPSMVENRNGTIFAGPGSRVTSDVLRGIRQPQFPATLTIPPKESRLLMNLPIPVATLTPPLNGRSTLMRLRSDGQVYVASLALMAKKNPDGSERPPTVEEWRSLLNTGKLAGARDRTPTPPDQTSGAIVYGRVAGVARGSRWAATLTDGDRPSNEAYGESLTIPARGEAFSYGLSTLARGRMGTGQNQSASMLVRYPDTAYEAHGNYGIEYNLTLPLHNATETDQTVTVRLETAIKEDALSRNGLRFFEPLPTQTFFRGTVRVRYRDDRGIPKTTYFHLVQKRGQQGDPLVRLRMPAGDRRLVEFAFLYPPDATPPQVLTVKTEESN